MATETQTIQTCLQTHLQEVVEVFKHADADLIQVFEESVEDGHQVGCRQLVSQNDSQLVDGERQCAPHLPLNQRRQKGLQPSLARRVRQAALQENALGSVLNNQRTQLLNYLKPFTVFPL